MMNAHSDIVEEYRTLRLQRQALTHQAQELEKQEKKLKAEIIRKLLAKEPLPSSVTLIEKLKPTVTDWPKLYAHIAKTGEFDLMQKRVMESAWLARFEDGTVVPGIQSFPVHDIKV